MILVVTMVCDHVAVGLLVLTALSLIISLCLLKVGRGASIVVGSYDCQHLHEATL